MIATYTEVAVSLLAEYLALRSPFIGQPGQPPYERLFTLFFSLTQAVYEAQIQRSGRHHDPPPVPVYLHPVYVCYKSRTTEKNLLNWAWSIHGYFDTS